jgi:hypothetical protein
VDFRACARRIIGATITVAAALANCRRSIIG